MICKSLGAYHEYNRPRHPHGGADLHLALSCFTGSRPVSDVSMKLFFDMDDRARLRERFFGACSRVLARI